MEYYIQVRKVYFYAAVGLLEGTEPRFCFALLVSMAELSWALVTSATAVAACSVADAPFVFLNAMYIKRSAECGAKNASDGINTLVLISFATSAALLGFVLTPAQRGRILPEFFLWRAGTRPHNLQS